MENQSLGLLGRSVNSGICGLLGKLVKNYTVWNIKVTAYNITWVWLVDIIIYGILLVKKEIHYCHGLRMLTISEM